MTPEEQLPRTRDLISTPPETVHVRAEASQCYFPWCFSERISADLRTFLGLGSFPGRLARRGRECYRRRPDGRADDRGHERRLRTRQSDGQWRWLGRRSTHIQPAAVSHRVSIQFKAARKRARERTTVVGLDARLDRQRRMRSARRRTQRHFLPTDRCQTHDQHRLDCAPSPHWWRTIRCPAVSSGAKARHRQTPESRPRATPRTPHRDNTATMHLLPDRYHGLAI